MSRSLVGATFLWTEQVYMFPCMSFISLDEFAFRGLVIETKCQVRKVGQICKFEWTHEEWVDYGWEILYAEEA